MPNYIPKRGIPLALAMLQDITFTKLLNFYDCAHNFFRCINV